MEYQIKYGSRNIDFSLEFKERKTLGIKVYPDVRVEVQAPFAANETEIISKVKEKAPWILKQIDHFNSYKPTLPQRRFVNGETHLYLGRQYKLKIVPDLENAIKAYRGQLWIHSQNPDPTTLKMQLNHWYKQRAIFVFNELLEEVLPRFKRYKIALPALTVRTMLKRWGSCTSSGKIILNTELIKAPKGSIEYVITHELCHLVYHNHTKAFQQLQDHMMPDWKKWKGKLEYSLV